MIKFVGHKAGVNSVVFNPTGTLIASGSSDNTVKLWENNSTGASATIRGHFGPVRAVSFSFDG